MPFTTSIGFAFFSIKPRVMPARFTVSWPLDSFQTITHLIVVTTATISPSLTTSLLSLSFYLEHHCDLS
jgi:hypothetical protein